MLAQQRAFQAQAMGSRPGMVTRVSAPTRLAVYARESRIGAKPVPVPKGVTVTIDGTTLKVKVRVVGRSRRCKAPACPRCHAACNHGAPIYRLSYCRGRWARWSRPSRPTSSWSRCAASCGQRHATG
jgi:hypothetical protein